MPLKPGNRNQSKLKCFTLLYRNIHFNVCLFIISFLLKWTYFHHKLVFLCFCSESCINFVFSLTLRVECLPMIRETRVQSQVESYQRLKKMVLDAALLNTQHCKVKIKGKVVQYREWVALSQHLSVVAIEKGAFGSPSTMVANFTYFLLKSMQTI